MVLSTSSSENYAKAVVNLLLHMFHEDSTPASDHIEDGIALTKAMLTMTDYSLRLKILRFFAMV